jgi:hypothetical protein
MQRGTDLKWIDAVKSQSGPIGHGHLAYRTPDGARHLCAIGVLADTLDPVAWRPSWIGDSWHGEVYTLPDWSRKRCKIKSPYFSFVDEDGQSRSIADTHYLTWGDVARDIERYYAQFYRRK